MKNKKEQPAPELGTIAERARFSKKEIAIAEDGLNEGLMQGIETPGLGFPIMKFNWQAKVWMIGQEVIAEPPLVDPVFYHPTARRNFESKFSEDPDQRKPPVCYSYDGANGSHPRITRVFNGVAREVYGNCRSCWLKEFGTRDCWQNNGQTGKAPQCSTNGILFAFLYGRTLPHLIHIPPTGVQSVFEAYNREIQRHKLPMRALRFRITPSGGGRKGNMMNLIVDAKLDEMEIERNKELAAEYGEFFVSYVQRFCEGGMSNEETEKREGFQQTEVGE